MLINLSNYVLIIIICDTIHLLSNSPTRVAFYMWTPDYINSDVADI